MINKPSLNITILFTTIFFICITLEIYCAHISYESYGWFMPRLLGMLIFVNLFAILFFINNHLKTSFGIVFLIAIFIIPNQLYRQDIHLKLKKESADVVNYVYQYKIRTGKFPENISGYTFKFPNLKQNLFYEYSKKDSTSFMVRYFVGDAASSMHYYDNSRGYHWQYYDD